MKRTFLLCVTWQGPSLPTLATMRELQRAGLGGFMEQANITDVALGRSLGFTAALQAVASFPELDTLLLLDDDIKVTAEQAQELVAASRRHRAPVSGVYGTRDGKVAATPLGGGEARPRWLAGLGFVALPIARLRALAADLPRVLHKGEPVIAFCRSGIHPDAPEQWTSEDYWFCRELGGVLLEPIPALHYKAGFVHVPERTLEDVRRVNRGELPAVRS